MNKVTAPTALEGRIVTNLNGREYLKVRGMIPQGALGEPVKAWPVTFTRADGTTVTRPAKTVINHPGGWSQMVTEGQHRRNLELRRTEMRQEAARWWPRPYRQVVNVSSLAGVLPYRG